MSDSEAVEARVDGVGRRFGRSTNPKMLALPRTQFHLHASSFLNAYIIIMKTYT